MKFLIVPFLLIFSFKASALQPINLSENAKISVLTISPGPDLNDAFGHSGFRINDPENNIDLVYNYGIYDFNTPNFYLKFAQGKLNYLIGVDEFNAFYYAYATQNRSIKEQILNLNFDEKNKLYHYLQNNLKPENHAYLYDFFYDNCATKIKDVTNIACNNKIQFNTPNHFKAATFRTLIQQHVNPNSWGGLGINIALGAVIDKPTRPQDHMFLPENIYAFFNAATLNQKPLIQEDKVLFKALPQNNSSPFYYSPLFVFSCIAIVILLITYFNFKSQKQSKSLDVLIFIFTGLIGLLVLFLWFGTNHKATHNNYNILWAFAPNILVFWQFLKSYPSPWFYRYLKFLLILLGILTLHWFTGVQVFSICIIPLIVALFIRYVFLLSYYRKNLKK